MAANVNSAYMLWRQFSGDARPVAQANLGSLRATTVQGEQGGSGNADAIRNFASAAGQFFGSMAQAKQVQTVEADRKVTDWMSKHTMQEYQQKMREGAVPFQDDPVAMDVLQNKSAYNVSLQVSQKIEEQIKAGAFKTVEEADKAHVAALEGARSEYVLSMGVSPDSKAFQTGFNKDSDQRRELLIRQQTSVTDKALRTQAKIAAQGELLAPMTPEWIKANPDKVGPYVVSTIEKQATLGQLRTDADRLEAYAGAVSHLAGQPGGASAIKALGELEVSVGDSKQTIRNILGGGTFDQTVLKALNLEQNQDASRQGTLNASILMAQQKNDLGALRKLRDQLVEESGGKMTQDITDVDRALQHTNEAQRRQNAVAAEQLAKAQEKQARVNSAVTTLRGVLGGALAGVSPNAQDLGLKDDAEARDAEQQLLGGIPEGPQRWAAALQMASFRPNGYADNTLKAMNVSAGASWSQYKHKLERGEDAALPEPVKQMQELYLSSPEHFNGSLGDTKYTTALDAARALGMSVEDYAKSEVAFGKLPEAQKKALKTEVDTRVASLGVRDTTYANGAVKALAGNYMAAGVGAQESVTLARESFKKQHTIVDQVPIHNTFFAFNGNPLSKDTGVELFKELRAEAVKDVGPEDVGAVYDKTTQTVRLVHLRTWEKIADVTRQSLQDRFTAKAGAAQAASNQRIEKAIAAEAAGANRRKTTMPTEADIIQQANPAWNN